MKKIILPILLGLITLNTYGQEVKKYITFASDTIGFIDKSYYVNNPDGNGKVLVNDVTITKLLNKNEFTMVENSYGGFSNINYDFKLASDYLKQSANYRDEAIITRLTTGLIGAGLIIVGGIIASKPSYTTTTTTTRILSYNQYTGDPYYIDIPTTTITPNNINRDLGLVIGGLGLGTAFVGFGVSINLDFKANEMLRKGAIKFNLKSL
jgi:hypothetical protein